MPKKTKELDNNEISEKTVTKKGKATEKKVETKTGTRTPKKASSPQKSSATKKATATKNVTSTKKETTTKKKTTTKKATSSTTRTKKASATTKKANKTTAKPKSSTSPKPSTRRVTKKATSEPKVKIVEYYDLPYRYHQTVVKLLAQTPNTLFIYWDISDVDSETLKQQYGDNFFDKTRPVLIVYNDTLHYRFEVEINDFANSWYLHVQDSNCHYHIELGRKPIPEYTKKEPVSLPDYFYIATSNPLITPNDHVLFTDEDITFRNVKTKEEYQKPISSFLLQYAKGKINTILGLYQTLYKEDSNFYDLSNPSSGNPTSGNFRRRNF